MATTSKMSIPYPAATDFVKDGATDMQAIADQVDLRSGLVKIIPTGATNGTVAANGDVTMNNTITSVTIANAFSADYYNYLVQVVGGSSSANNVLTIQVGATVTNYYWGIVFNSWNNVTASLGSTTGTSYNYAGTAHTTGLYMHCDIFQPYLTENTRFKSTWNALLDQGYANGCLFNTTSYTDLKILVSAGTMSAGIVRIYGYN